MANPQPHCLDDTAPLDTTVRPSRLRRLELVRAPTNPYDLFTSALTDLQRALGWELVGWEIVGAPDQREWSAGAWVRSADSTCAVTVRVGEGRGFADMDSALIALAVELRAVEMEVGRG